MLILHGKDMYMTTAKASDNNFKIIILLHLFQSILLK
jgi:hypothetical protein